MIRDVTNQRFQEICATKPELLENREDVTVWEQECFGNPREKRYIFELNKKEIARFSVFTKLEATKFTVTASVPIFA